MAIHVALNHVTHYTYDRLINLGPHVVRLRPAPHCRTKILSYSLKILPESHFINWQQDPQSNFQARLIFPEKAKELRVEVDLIAEMAVINPFDFFLEPDAEHFPFSYDSALQKELKPFLKKSPPRERMRAFTKKVDLRRRRVVEFLVHVNQLIHDEVKYVIRMEPGVQSPEETLQKGSGSCRDSAWLMVQTLRQFGLAARFVSGYLIQLKSDVKALDGPSGSEVDFTDLHAWTEVYLPGAGWVGLDPTSGLFASEGHIPLAATPEPSSAAPISGILDECEVEFAFSMSINRVYEAPRVTLPYTEEQWSRIESLGHELDVELRENDVRLTMGGEPTFVSIDDLDGDEWNTTAMGPSKRPLADELLRRMQKQFSTGALLHHGQGKWYPGEQLPRWNFGCYWRRDGQPMWQDHRLIADEGRDYGFTEKEGELFTNLLARHIEVDPRFIVPAYEDTWYYLWKERRLPTNVDPFKSRLKDEMERERLAKIFESGLERVKGHVLPVQRWQGNNGSYWVTGPWFLRPERMYLIPGDSPIGYRLPLDSLPWVRSTETPWVYEWDPSDERPPLPARKDRQRILPPEWRQREGEGQGGYGSLPAALCPRGQKLGASGPGGIGDEDYENDPEIPEKIREEIKRLRAELLKGPPAQNQSCSWQVRTALCVEARQGRLHVFMPPVRTLEDYLDIVTAVEATAAELDMPVQLEGYTPPSDPRLNKIGVTPDPGVIEVNMHPSQSWDEMVRATTVLYEEARLTRLGTEKFMLDGRHTGTGGGNHIVVGGSTPQDSPLLRRPHLLRSLINYWHNHPSLSYLFSGLFIGPTSQSPRIDEARNDSLYEMELAFQQLPDHTAVPPWHVDRVMRNLLIDVTGNTHRAEFCIDKLYSPDGNAGRLGLLELRAFEMPPHARMSLTQQLLLRTLISRFWNEPCHTPLVRWGTELHDRFMLPHFNRQDFEDIVEDLNDAGYPFEADWFNPHFEFRFPRYGAITQRGVTLEVRQALEPWHVLGENGTPGGNVRYVDSSLERVQVKLNGLVDSRHVLVCNGRRVPLQPTGTVGEYVAGVRYRAWQPPTCLHPTIPVHAPLVFDIVDTWNNRAIGGCSYYVSHPGGLSYETLPVNSYEAESRRLTRFFGYGHTPGSKAVPELIVSPEFPMTLDLRQG